MRDSTVAVVALIALAGIVTVFVVVSEIRLRRKRREVPGAVALSAPVCTMCVRPDDGPLDWNDDAQFCSRCHKTTTCFRALVRGPRLVARS